MIVSNFNNFTNSTYKKTTNNNFRTLNFQGENPFQFKKK